MDRSTGRGALGASTAGLEDPFALDASRGCFCSDALASSSAFLLAGIPFPGLADAVDEGREGFPSMEARRSPIYSGGRGQPSIGALGIGLNPGQTTPGRFGGDRDQISD